MALCKYIFLDFDGPLNTGRNDYLDPDRYGHHFDEMAVRNLRRIIDATDAQIVVSSSWRHLGVERIRQLWAEWGLPGKIAGCTPGVWGDDRQFDSRGEEIRQWLAENANGNSSYVILDDMDNSEAADGQKDKWIQVNPHCGITQEDADRAIKVLNRVQSLAQIVNPRNMMRDEDKMLLFPAYPLMHVGWGDDWKDYLLSGILATHGYTIRRIQYETDGGMQVFCRCASEENPGRGILFFHPMNDGKIPCPPLHWNDLRIRYHNENGNLSDPVWVQAYAYGNGKKGAWLAAILDLIEMKYSEL